MADRRYRFTNAESTLMCLPAVHSEIQLGKMQAGAVTVAPERQIKGKPKLLLPECEENFFES